MKMIHAILSAPKAMPFETKQALYGVSILVTFLAVGRLGMLA